MGFPLGPFSEHSETEVSWLFLLGLSNESERWIYNKVFLYCLASFCLIFTCNFFPSVKIKTKRPISDHQKCWTKTRRQFLLKCFSTTRTYSSVSSQSRKSKKSGSKYSSNWMQWVQIFLIIRYEITILNRQNGYILCRHLHSHWLS